MHKEREDKEDLSEVKPIKQKSKMKKEIRKDVREYILSEVNETLARLGVSEKIVETEEWTNKYGTMLHYCFESAPIRQMPMMFKKLVVGGYMTSVEVNDENSCYFKAQEKNDIVVVNMDYKYDHLNNRGSNGCDIGRMIFYVSKDLPKSFDEKEYIEPRTYIYKAEGLMI